MTPWRTRAKQAARTTADRVMAPYVERLAAEIRAAGAVTGASPPPVVPDAFVVPTEQFHAMLHELRTIELERLDGPLGRVVSVGASGRWYFDWFEQAVGRVDEHVGVEAFEAEPDDVPANVWWMAATADRFDGIADESADLVFAGQTTEHLWADELTGFLLEARRVIRPHGVLVLDSPNRLVTEHLDWSHGGHTVELSPSEIRELVRLAGFDVRSLRGLWRCRFGACVLELEERLADPALLVRRVAEGPDRPDDAFVWWLVAVPDGAPDAAQLRRRVDELYRDHWPTRVCRGMWPGPPDDGVDVPVRGSIQLRSLPFMLGPGTWRVGVRLTAGSTSDVGSVRVRTVRPDGDVVDELTSADAVTDRTGWTWQVTQSDVAFALSLVLAVDGVTNDVRVRMPLDVSRA